MKLNDIIENNNFKNIHLIHIGDKIELDKNENNEPKKEEVNQEVTAVEEAPVAEAPVIEQVVPEQPVSNSVKDADYAAQRMSDATGLSKAHWAGVIFRESGNNPNITNATGHFGFFQIDPIHGLVDTSVDGQINKAIEIYNAQGGNAWEAW